MIRGVGNEYATSADYKLLRDLYPSVNSDQERNAIINAVGNAGGNGKRELAARHRAIADRDGRSPPPGRVGTIAKRRPEGQGRAQGADRPLAVALEGLGAAG